ncbi:hypothetical protein J7W08_00315 [Methanococcoides orientis]|uniref:hypothetical protein n=1 Tax=Methanococcoides orientis TaxID=2822137 RepID=UPI001E29967F|nr:hypothetical protein [Methanococcoides orientis]UGV40829.1 hypothetical protein J7W08_00315 [Methanococcoides orientis]
MKLRLVISMVLVAMFFMVPASADLFDDLNAQVGEYNDKIDQVPGTVQSIFSDQHVILAVYMNDAENGTTDGPDFDVVLSDGPFVTESGVTMNMIAITGSDASVSNFGKWGELDSEYKWDGVDFTETIIVTTNEDTARAILDSESPGEVFLEAYDSGMIIIEGADDASITTKIYIAVMPLVMKLYALIS